MLLWHHVKGKDLEALQSLFPKKSIVGAASGDYMLFKCTSCGEQVDMTYKYGDPVMPHFSYKCGCGNEGEFKLDVRKMHDLPVLRADGTWG